MYYIIYVTISPNSNSRRLTMKNVLLWSLLLISFFSSINQALAWKVMYKDDDGKLETAWVECDNGKQFALSRWIYENANKYQRMWHRDSGKMASSNSTNVSFYATSCQTDSGHYDLGTYATKMCKCLKSK